MVQLFHHVPILVMVAQGEAEVAAALNPDMSERYTQRVAASTNQLRHAICTTKSASEGQGDANFDVVRRRMATMLCSSR